MTVQRRDSNEDLEEELHIRFPEQTYQPRKGPFLQPASFREHSVLGRILDAQVSSSEAELPDDFQADGIWLPSPEEFRRPFQRKQSRQSMSSGSKDNQPGSNKEQKSSQDPEQARGPLKPGTLSQGQSQPKGTPGVVTVDRGTLAGLAPESKGAKDASHGSHSQGNDALQGSCNPSPSKGSSEADGRREALPLGRTVSYAASHNGCQNDARSLTPNKAAPPSDKPGNLVISPVDTRLHAVSCQGSAADVGHPNVAGRAGRDMALDNHAESIDDICCQSNDVVPDGVDDDPVADLGSYARGRKAQKGARKLGQSDRLARISKQGNQNRTAAGDAEKRAEIISKADEADKREGKATEAGLKAMAAPALWSKNAAKGVFTARVVGGPKTVSKPAEGQAFLHPPPKPKDHANLGVSSAGAKLPDAGPAKKTTRGRPKKGTTGTARPAEAIKPRKGKIGKIRTNLAKKKARGGGQVGSRGAQAQGAAEEMIEEQDPANIDEDTEQGHLKSQVSGEQSEDELDDLLMAEFNDSDPNPGEDLSVQGGQIEKDSPGSAPATSELIVPAVQKPAELVRQSGPSIAQQLADRPLKRNGQDREENLKASGLAALNQVPGKHPGAQQCRGDQPEGAHKAELLPATAVDPPIPPGNEPKDERTAEPNILQEDRPRSVENEDEDEEDEEKEDALPTSPNAALKTNRGPKKRKQGTRVYHHLELLNPESPIYDKELDEALRALKPKLASTRIEGTQLLSGLTKQQHAWYLTNSGQKSLAGKQLANMQELQAAIEAEQDLYWRVTCRLGSLSCAESLTFLPPAATLYFQRQIALRREAVRKGPQFYQLHSNVDLDAVRLKPNVLMKVDTSASDAGGGCSFSVPSCPYKLDLDSMFDALSQGDTTGEASETNSSEKCPGVEMHFKALHAVMGFLEPDFGPDWELPIQISHDSSGEKQIRVGEPLPARQLLLRDLHTEMYNACMIAQAKSEPSAQSAPLRKVAFEVDHRKVSVNCQQMLHRKTQASNLPIQHQGEQPTDGGEKAVMRVKPVYHSPEQAKQELISDAEWASWWLSVYTQQASVLQVAYVTVGQSEVVHVEQIPSDQLLSQVLSKQIPQRFSAWWLSILDRIQKLPKGAFLLTHAKKSSKLTIWQASAFASKGPTSAPKRALPLDGSKGVNAGSLYDLWQAHSPEKPFQPMPVEYVPLKWKPLDPKVTQIPHTFKPRSNMPNRSRKRKLQPSFLANGYGADWDEMTQELQTGQNNAPAKTDLDMYGDL